MNPYLERNEIMNLTHTDYLNYKQCPKSLWIKKYNPNVLKKMNDKSRFEKENEIKELARTLFPNGDLIAPPLYLHELKSELTHKALKNGVKTVYEPTFITVGIIVSFDILHQDEEGWKIYKVTSSTQVKERHLDNLAFIYFGVQQFVPIHSVHVIHINNQYVRTGDLDFEELFTICDVTDEVNNRLSLIPFEVNSIVNMLQKKEPNQVIGQHCKKYGKNDLECAASGHCWSHVPDYSIFNITRIGKKAFDLYQDGILSIRDVPNDFKLTETQAIQVNAYKENRSFIETKKIGEFLESFKLPLYFLDFETFQSSIPMFDGVRPYQHIPFQYSLHIVTSMDDEIEHKEFLAKEGSDPRRELAERLVQNIPRGGDHTVVAYNMAFEKSRLKELSYDFPDLADHLMNIHDNMVDLMVPFQNKWYYTNEMKGSYSIKYVLPALFPHDETLNYQNLNIQNGGMAMDIYERLHTYPKEEIEAIRTDLLAYCKMDTLAMVRIWEYLSDLK
jgi:hypothetical protein